MEISSDLKKQPCCFANIAVRHIRMCLFSRHKTQEGYGAPHQQYDSRLHAQQLYMESRSMDVSSVVEEVPKRVKNS